MLVKRNIGFCMAGIGYLLSNVIDSSLVNMNAICCSFYFSKILSSLYLGELASWIIWSDRMSLSFKAYSAALFYSEIGSFAYCSEFVGWDCERYLDPANFKDI